MKGNDAQEKLISDWLRLAHENLLFARSGLNEEYSPFHTICYLCQGSAEKYLKAFLLRNAWELEKTHDLLKLLVSCIEFDGTFAALKEPCVLLNEYITAGRYPDDLPFENISREDASEAIEAANKIEHLVTAKMNYSFPAN